MGAATTAAVRHGARGIRLLGRQGRRKAPRHTYDIRPVDEQPLGDDGRDPSDWAEDQHRGPIPFCAEACLFVPNPAWASARMKVKKDRGKAVLGGVAGQERDPCREPGRRSRRNAAKPSANPIESWPTPLENVWPSAGGASSRNGVRGLRQLIRGGLDKDAADATGRVDANPEARFLVVV